MSAAVMWIRNNMLLSPDRKLTAAEMKVQKSLEKLSIPEWYMKKRTNPPKIMNMTPIESRPSVWKYSSSPSNLTLNSTSSNLSDTLATDYQKPSPKLNNDVTTPTATKLTVEQKSPEAKQKKAPQKFSLPKDAIFNSKIFEAKISPRSNSHTFPKISPSRKIQNINIVFPPGPKIEISKQLEENTPMDEYKYKTYLIKRSPDSAKNGNNNAKEENESPKKNNNKVLSTSSDATPKKNSQIPRKKSEETPTKINSETPVKNHLRVAEMASPLRTPDIKTNFKIRTTSTPKYSPANLFSSTIIEAYPKVKKTRSPNILEKSSIFENSSNLDSTFNTTKDRSGSFMEKSFSSSRNEKSSQSFLNRIPVFYNSSCENQEESKSSKTSWLLEKNIRSIDPILFEKDDSPPTLKSPSIVRKMIKKMEMSHNSAQDQSFNNLQRKQRNSEANKACNNSLVSDRSLSNLKNDECQRLDYSNSVAVHDKQTVEEDDSVYWIPVSKCKLPRTSSLLSMMSRQSNECQSPCVSPIRNEREDDNWLQIWGTDFKKTSTISRKLFRIDETIVIDSGYSEKSDRSAVSSGFSVADYTWSEENLYDSEAEFTTSTFKRSANRKSMIGQTYCIR